MALARDFCSPSGPAPRGYRFQLQADVIVSAPGNRPSAIARIRALLSEPTHHYRPATTVFLDLNVDRVAEEFRLATRGNERGAQNRPTTDAKTMDDVERQVVERLEAHKQDANVI